MNQSPGSELVLTIRCVDRRGIAAASYPACFRYVGISLTF